MCLNCRLQQSPASTISQIAADIDYNNTGDYYDNDNDDDVVRVVVVRDVVLCRCLT